MLSPAMFSEDNNYLKVSLVYVYTSLYKHLHNVCMTFVRAQQKNRKFITFAALNVERSFGQVAILHSLDSV
jgi:hypothetical protein